MGEAAQNEIIRRIRAMDPYQFEQLVAEIWELSGYETTVKKGSGDRGIDIGASKNTPYDQYDLIQTKRYSENNTIGSGQVRSYSTLYNQVPEADVVVLVTTGYFTSEAERLAADLNVKIIDGDGIAELIEKHSHNLKNLPRSSEKKQKSELTEKSGGSDEKPDPVNVDKGDTVWTRSDQNKAEVIKVRDSSEDYVVLVDRGEFKTKRAVSKHEIAKDKQDL